MSTIIIKDHVINYTISEDGKNCKIHNGYKYNDKNIQEEFIKLVLPKYFFGYRDMKSYMNEWRAHNILYKLHLFRSHTVDTDLNVNETKFRRAIYWLISKF